MKLTAFQKAELQFASNVGYLKAPLRTLWKEDNLRRAENTYGPRELSYEVFLESFLTAFRLAFILRKEDINYSYQELTEEDFDAFWNNNRKLFTRYGGDSFDKEECLDIIAKKIREQEYLKNVTDLLLQSQEKTF